MIFSTLLFLGSPTPLCMLWFFVLFIIAVVTVVFFLKTCRVFLMFSVLWEYGLAIPSVWIDPSLSFYLFDLSDLGTWKISGQLFFFSMSYLLGFSDVFSWLDSGYVQQERHRVWMIPGPFRDMIYLCTITYWSHIDDLITMISIKCLCCDVTLFPL